MFSRPENLDPDKGESQRIQEAIGLNQELFNIYYLKEVCNSLGEQSDRQHAEGVMEDFL